MDKLETNIFLMEEYRERWKERHYDMNIHRFLRKKYQHIYLFFLFSNSLLLKKLIWNYLKVKYCISDSICIARLQFNEKKSLEKAIQWKKSSFFKYSKITLRFHLKFHYINSKFAFQFLLKFYHINSIPAEHTFEFTKSVESRTFLWHTKHHAYVFS